MVPVRKVIVVAGALLASAAALSGILGFHVLAEPKKMASAGRSKGRN